MGKILATIFLIVFVYFTGPKLWQGLWYSPTLYPTDWWGEKVYNYDSEVAKQGGGWFNIDPREDPTSGRTTASVFNSL
jgi:hypothetical protein